MAKVSITLKKSPIGCLPNQRKTLKALGLTKINKTVELEKKNNNKSFEPSKG